MGKNNLHSTASFYGLVLRAAIKYPHKRFAHSSMLLSLLSACGGGGSSTREVLEPSTQFLNGKVIDGYISGASVFIDINGNYFKDQNEFSVLTNRTGSYSGLPENSYGQIVANSNDGSAVDISTGLPFLATLSAPSNYKVVTPITTLVAVLQKDGLPQSTAEEIVASVLDISPDINLSTFDPFVEDGDASSQYKTVNIKVANILMASDGDLIVDGLDGVSDTLKTFSQLLQASYERKDKLDLSDFEAISNLLPLANNDLKLDVAQSNTPRNYEDILDKQLILLSDNSGGELAHSTNDGFRFIAVEIDNQYNVSDVFKAQLIDTINGDVIESIELISFGKNVAVFKFLNSDLEKFIGTSAELKVRNESTGETYNSSTSFIVTQVADFINPAVDFVDDSNAVTDAGVVADGYISGARVFRDEVNTNGIFDAGETFVLTNSYGEFEGLGGDPNKPIVADGNNGTAIDTSTGITFNSILSAPAGSKVVNPITTIVNELMIDDPDLELADANLSVARAMGLTNVVDSGGAQIDFTKFDPISNKVFGDTGNTSINADLATVTQGVATFVANLIVSGANEKGGDVSTQLATTRSIITNLKNTVQTKSADVARGDNTAVFNFSDSNDILSALGSDFNGASSTLEKLQDEFTGFDTTNPAATASTFNNDTLIEKQLLAQSEFGDGVLTDAEAANGAVLVIGPTYDPENPSLKLESDGIATVKITNITTGKILNPFPTVIFSNSKYASINLTANQLNNELGELGGGTLKVEVKLGSLSAANWDSSSSDIIYQTDTAGIYFHKGIEPALSFDTDKVVVDIAGGVALVTSTDTTGFQLSGQVNIDLGLSQLPTGITLGHLVDGLGDNYNDGAGRNVTIEFLNSSGSMVFSTSVEVEPSTNAVNASSNTGQGSFIWTKSFDNNLKSDADSSVKFSDIPDGDYSIKASFTDAYGANSSTTFSNLKLDRNPPEISSISRGDASVNVSDEKISFKINLKEAIASYNAEKIHLDINGTPSKLSDLSGSASVSLNSSSDKLTIDYTPTGSGTVKLAIDDGAFVDTSGNTYVAPASTDENFINFSNYSVDYDMTAPTINSFIIEERGSPETSLNLGSDDTSLVTKIVFDDKVNGLSLSDLSVSTIGNVKAATLSNLRTVDESDTANYEKTWYADMALADGLDGNFKVSLSSNSYTDDFGNLGPAGATADIAIDTRAAVPFQVSLKNEKAQYARDEEIIIKVVFDEALTQLSDTQISNLSSKPTISLNIGEYTREAELYAISKEDGSSTFNIAEFKYTVSSSDLSDDAGIIVANNISLASLNGADGNPSDNNIGSVSNPLNLSGKSVNGGTRGSGVDGYLEGAVIYADNDQDNTGLPIATIGGNELSNVTTRTAYDVYSLTSDDHGVSSIGKYVIVGNDNDGWSAYSVTGDGSNIPYDINDTKDGGAINIDQSIVDALIPISISIDRVENVYQLVDDTHGVSQSGQFVVRGNEESGFLAFAVTGNVNSYYTTSADPDSATLKVYKQTDIVGGAGLTEGDAIAQADATGGFVIYGADGPLVLEGGFDISTNKDFTVRYKAPDDYTVINPISTLVVAGTSAGANSSVSADTVFNEVYSQYAGNTLGVETGLTSADFKTYNAYDRIAQAADLAIANSGTTADVNSVVADALIYQKAAASYAVIVDFISNAAYHAKSENTSITTISDSVFAAISGNLSSLTRTFANVDFAPIYGGNNDTSLSNIKAKLKSTLDNISGVSDLKSDLTRYDTYNLDSDDITELSISGLISAGTYGLEINVDGTGRLVLVEPDTNTSAVTNDYEEVIDGGALSIELTPAEVNSFSSINPAGVYISDEIYELLAHSIVAINNADTSYPMQFKVYNIDVTNAGIIGLDISGLTSTGMYALREDDGHGSLIAVAADNSTLSINDDYLQVIGNSAVTIDLSAEEVTSFKDLGLIAVGNASLVSQDEVIAAAEAGINALTEIVQVQAVVQSNILGDVVSFYEGGKQVPLSIDLNASSLLGSDSSSGYLVEPVGTVVPIRYELKVASGSQSIAFESDETGAGATFDFTVTRSGSIKTTSSLEYVIEGGVDASDISGGNLTGEIFFDVNEKDKTISISLNNDTLREASETLTIVISDPTQTSMIVQDRASVTIKDDDPSTPEVSLSRSEYTMTEGATEFLDIVNIDYFDPSAYFKLEWVDTGGTLSTSIGSSNYDSTAFVSSYDMQTNVLRNLEFQANSGLNALSQSNVIFTLTAAENSNGSGRSSSTEFDINFDVHRLPTIDISGISFETSSSFAGVPTQISGITFSDPDNDYLTVTVETDLAGTIYSVSTADYSLSENSSTSVSFSGTKGNVQDALDNLRFVADAAGDVKLSVKIDDNDVLHNRNADGTLMSASSSDQMSVGETIAASPPTIKQTFEPFVKVGSGFWSGFSGIEVDDLDTEIVNVTITGISGVLSIYQLTNSEHGVSSDGLYAVSGSGGIGGWSAYTVSGSGTSQNPYSLSSTADTGSNTLTSTVVDSLTKVGVIGQKVNFRLSDGPEGLAVPVLQVPSGTLEFSGAPEYINNLLNLLEVEVSDNTGGLVSVTVNDGSISATSTPSYVPVLNAVPDAGGNVFASNNIDEDGGAQAISINGIRLFDADAQDASGDQIDPKNIRIVSSKGGEVLTSSGVSVFDLSGAPIDITLENGVLNLQFIPDADFNGNAKIKYVVVDPQQGTFISPVSEITVDVQNVNDAPTVRLSPVPTIYTQGQDAVSIFSNVSVSDIDDIRFSEVKITVVLDTLAGDQPLIAPDQIFGMTKSVEGDTISYSGASISSANVAALLGNIKFQTNSNNLIGETRSIQVSVKDEAGLESVIVSKDVILLDVNDAPEIRDGVTSRVYTEGSATGVVMSNFGSIVDPESDNISKVVIMFESGYKLGQDIITYRDASGSVTTEFDEATGAFTIASVSSSGLAAEDFNSILSNVEYINTSDDPQDGSIKEISFELTDANGQPGVSSLKTISLTAINDIPEIYTLIAGSEETNLTGAKFVSGANAARVAPNLSVRDADSNEFQLAVVIVKNSSTSFTSTLSLTENGKQIETAFNLEVEIVDAVEGVVGPSLKIYKGTEGDDNYVTRGTLEAILREVSYSNSGSNIGGNEEIIEFVVTDKDGAVSNSIDNVPIDAFSSSVSLLDTPPLEVKPITVETGSDLQSIGATGTANVLTFNADANDTDVRLFYANKLTTDLSTSTIRVDGIRYKYDPSITSDRIALNKAAHVDLRLLDGDESSTVTSIMGLSNSNIIYGSDYADYVDGRGGKDIVKSGAGDDIVVLRIDTDGAEFHGGDGSDTLLLPGSASGTIDLENFSNYASNVTVQEFENIDARSSATGLTLKGSSVSNELLAGTSIDTIWLGEGGDKAFGGPGTDTFVIDVSASSTGGAILDLSNEDIIKIHDGSGYVATSNVTWLHYPGYSDAPEITTDYIASVTSSGTGHSLNIENKDGKITSISIGTSIYGSLGKWDQLGETDFSIKPTINNATTFNLRGPITSETSPIELTADGSGGFTYGLTGDGNIVSIADADADEQVHLNLSATGVDVTVGGAKPSLLGNMGTVSEINALLETVKVTGTSRGDGEVTLTMSDGFSTPISKTIFFEIPNSQPILSIDGSGMDQQEFEGLATSGPHVGNINNPFLDDGTVGDLSIYKFSLNQYGAHDAGNYVVISDDSKYVAYHVSGDGLTEPFSIDLNQAPVELSGAILTTEVDSKISLGSSGFYLSIDDSDDLDLSDKTLSVNMEINGGQVSYDGAYNQFVKISGGKVTIAYDGQTTIPDDLSWFKLLVDLTSSVEVTRSVYGDVQISTYVSDLEDVSSTINTTFNFEAKQLAKPDVLTSAGGPGNDGSLVLNGTQFDAGKLRVFVKDVGASVGDQLVITTKIDGVTQSIDDKLIPNSSVNPNEIAPFVEFNLKDLVSEANKNGKFEITAALKIDGSVVSTTDLSDPVVFNVDTIEPASPIIEYLNASEDGLSYITDDDVFSITVSDQNSEENLTYSVVKIFNDENGEWYNLSNNFDLNSLRLGNGQFFGEINATNTFDEIDKTYTISLGSNSLSDGVYAVIARDEVGNVSSINTSNFDISTKTLPASVFIIDKELDQDDIGYSILNAQYIDGVDYRYYKLGADQASNIEIGVRPQQLGGLLPKDVIGLKIEVWSDANNTGSETVEPDVSAEFERDLSASSNFWSKKTGIDGAYVEISNSKSTALSPVLVLDLQTGLSGTTGNVGVRISVEDIAGNLTFIDTPYDQIELDLIADEISEEDLNSGLVTSLVSEDIYSGISRKDAQSLSVDLIGLDADAQSRSSFLLSEDQFYSSLKLVSNGLPAALSAEQLKELTLDENYVIVNGQKLPSFGSGNYFLDIEAAFLSSLKHSNTSEAPESLESASDWKIIGVSGDKAEYISHSDWNDYALGNTAKSDLNVFLSSYIMNSHKFGDPLTKLAEFSQDVTPILKSSGSSDETLRILNQIFDVAGNTAFRDGILLDGEFLEGAINKLRLDVKDALVQDGLTLGIGNDTGVYSDDLVTIDQHPSFTFSTDEEIVSARLIQVSHLASVTEVNTLSEYDLSIRETDLEDGFTYNAELTLENVNLSHGLWAIEITDVAGNTGVSDTSPLQLGSGYNTNVDLSSLTNGVFVVDTIAPPNAIISIESVELEGGYINQYEQKSSLAIEVLPGHDDLFASDVSALQVSDVTNVSVLLSSSTVIDLGNTPVSSTDGVDRFEFDATSLADGSYTVRVTSQDTAGNETTNDYDFILDTQSPEAPVANLIVDGVNSGAEFAGDGVLNRSEIGYGTPGKDVGISISLSDPIGTSILSVKIDDYEVEGVPIYVLQKEAYGGVLEAGNYIINKLSDTEFEAYLVTGLGTGASPYKVSDLPIPLTGMHLDDFEGLPSPTRDMMLPISVLGEAENPSIIGSYIVNLMDVISPDEYHSKSHTLSVVVKDFAGNLTTQTLDFEIDTKLPGSPDILVERTATSSEALDLNYWETVDTFNGEKGVRFQIIEASETDKILIESIKVNGVSATSIDMKSGIYFVERSDLNDSLGGLTSVGNVDFELDGVLNTYSIFKLNKEDHGVSSNGNYILVGNADDGWIAYPVLGDGSITDFSVSSSVDTGSLKDTLLHGTNVIEFDMQDASGNVNTYLQYFTSDLDQESGQFFAITPSIHTINFGEDEVLRLDVFVTDHALDTVSGQSKYNGSSFDIRVNLPDTIFDFGSEHFSFRTHNEFFYSNAKHYISDNSVVFGAFSDNIFTDNDKPIVSIDVIVDDISSILEKSGEIVLDLVKMSEISIPSSDDALNLTYTIYLDDLILTPLEQTL